MAGFSAGFRRIYAAGTAHPAGLSPSRFRCWDVPPGEPHPKATSRAASMASRTRSRIARSLGRQRSDGDTQGRGLRPYTDDGDHGEKLNPPLGRFPLSTTSAGVHVKLVAIGVAPLMSHKIRRPL